MAMSAEATFVARQDKQDAGQRVQPTYLLLRVYRLLTRYYRRRKEQNEVIP